MTAMASDQPHVVTRAVASMRARVSGLAGVSLWSMGPVKAGSTLVELADESGLCPLCTPEMTSGVGPDSMADAAA